MVEGDSHEECWMKAVELVKEKFPDFKIDPSRTDFRQVPEFEADFENGLVREVRGSRQSG